MPLSREQCRTVDRRAQDEYRIPGLVLMENAGRGAADVLCQLIASRADATESGRARIVICCGKGNNAGDGFVLARHLDLRRHVVRVLLWAEPDELQGDAGANFQIIRKAGLPIEVFGNRHDPRRLAENLAGATWIVDALLGTGARGEPRPPLDAVIDQINAAAAPKLAIDLPSGLDCDTGQAARAHHSGRRNVYVRGRETGLSRPRRRAVHRPRPCPRHRRQSRGRGRGSGGSQGLLAGETDLNVTAQIAVSSRA